jgi:hypothetical protein
LAKVFRFLLDLKNASYSEFDILTSMASSPMHSILFQGKAILHSLRNENKPPLDSIKADI